MCTKTFHFETVHILNSNKTNFDNNELLKNNFLNNVIIIYSSKGFGDPWFLFIFSILGFFLSSVKPKLSQKFFVS